MSGPFSSHEPHHIAIVIPPHEHGGTLNGSQDTHRRILAMCTNRKVSTTATMIAAALCARTAVAQDISRPGNPITASSTNSPGAEGVANVIDNTANTKYLNF